MLLSFGKDVALTLELLGQGPTKTLVKSGLAGVCADLVLQSPPVALCFVPRQPYDDAVLKVRFHLLIPIYCL